MLLIVIGKPLPLKGNQSTKIEVEPMDAPTPTPLIYTIDYAVGFIE